MSKEAQREDDFDELDSAIDAAFKNAEKAKEEPEVEEVEVSSEGEAEESADPEHESEQEEGESEPVEQTETQEPGIEPPAFFNSEEKEAFKSYPREMQQAIERVASGLRRRVSEDTEKLAPLRRLGDVLAPVMPEIQRLGVGPEQFISNLLRGRALIKQDPIAGLEALGIDTQQLLNGMGQGEEHDAFPAVFQQRLERLEQERESQRREVEARTYQDQFGMARAFRDEVDDSGRLVRPFLEIDPVTDQPRYPGFVEEVTTQVSLLTKGGQATREVLEKAYERALRLSDDAQSVLAQRKKAEEVKSRQKTLAGKKNASSSISNNSASNRVSAADEYDLGKSIDKLFAAS
jgi:hypothetical protein